MNMLDKIIDRYKHPKNKGVLSNWSYKSQSDNPMCGDDITVYIQCDNEIVTKASFSGAGCSISQGCADMMCERILGLNINELKNLKFDLFNLEKSPISKSRYKCATLSLEAINNIKKEQYEESSN